MLLIVAGMVFLTVQAVLTTPPQAEAVNVGGDLAASSRALAVLSAGGVASTSDSGTETAAAAAALLLAGCGSSVKLDDGAPVEDRLPQDRGLAHGHLPSLSATALPMSRVPASPPMS